MPHALGHSQEWPCGEAFPFPQPNERQNRRTMKNGKRIHSVTVRRMIDESPDTSWLGKYSNRSESEYAIDRAHAQDCASVRQDIKDAKATLEHVQQTIGDLHNDVLAQYNGT